MYDQIISGSVSNHRTKEIQQRIHPARILLQGPPNSSYSASEPTVGITAGSWCIHRSESPCATQGTHTRKVCVRKMRAREKQSHVILQSNLFSLFLPWSCSYWENQSISQGPGVYKHDALHSPKPLSTSYTQRGLRGRVLPPHCLRVLVHHRMALPRQLLQLSPPPCARVINLRPYRHHVPVRCNFYADLRLRPKPVMGSTISKPVHQVNSDSRPTNRPIGGNSTEAQPSTDPLPWAVSHVWLLRLTSWRLHWHCDLPPEPSTPKHLS